MEKESTSVRKTIPNIMVTGKKVWDMVMVDYNLVKIPHMKDSFNMVIVMEKEKWNMHQEIFMKVGGKTTRNVDMEWWIGSLRVKNMKVNGLMICNMD